ncbi:M14 family zinc carboxypeptidase [Sinimarinibacterium thermocellulolyticum]|uniref:M14 family zinc carboxypeptidase n=1 Tax=Sinimarinibacterium thermocellulolyticum TaxID=3170016 RepID=A0ABV2A9N1_9GAMM
MHTASAALLLIAASAAQAHDATPAEIDTAMRAAAVEAKAYADELSIVAGLQRAQAASARDALAAEARMLQLLIRLREVRTPHPQTRAAVTGLRDYVSRTLTDPVDPEQRGMRRPAYPIAGAARALLRRWDRPAHKSAPAPSPAPGVLVLTEDEFGENRVPLGYPVPTVRDDPQPGDGFRSYAALQTRLAMLAAGNPDLRSNLVGRSREQRDIVAWTLGDADDTTPTGTPESAALINGTIHAREWASPEVVVGLIERFAERADDGGLYRYLLDHVNLVVVPVLNVDGFVHTQRTPSVTLESEAGDPIPAGQPPEYAHYPRDGRLRRKNLRDVDADACPMPASGCMNGVDLNRNADSPFFASGINNSGDPLSIVYHGPAPASEPETLALYAAADLAPRERLRLYVDVHSFGRVFFGVNTGAARRDAITAALVPRMSGATGRGSNRYPYDATPPGVGIGSTDEVFGYGLQIPAYTLEIEPTTREGGTTYGGFGYHHDGFILPQSEIARVRRELADALTLGLYRMAGPPTLIEAEIRELDGARLVYSARWQVQSHGRVLQTEVAEALVADTAYRLRLVFDKPMRVRDAQNRVVAYAGQTAPLAPSVAIEGLSADGASFREDLGTDAQNWLTTRYADDAYALDFTLPASLPLRGARRLNLRVDAQDLSGQALDANPATLVDWDAGWSGYEDDEGRDDTDRGGADRSQRIIDDGSPTPGDGGGSGGGAFGALGLLAALIALRRRGTSTV